MLQRRSTEDAFAAGPYKKGYRLYPVDKDDPLAFESVSDDKLMQLAIPAKRRRVY